MGLEKLQSCRRNERRDSREITLHDEPPHFGGGNENVADSCSGYFDNLDRGAGTDSVLQPLLHVRVAVVRKRIERLGPDIAVRDAKRGRVVFANEEVVMRGVEEDVKLPSCGSEVNDFAATRSRRPR